MFRIVLDNGKTQRVLNRANNSIEGWTMMAKHAMALIVGDEGIMYGTRKLEDGYAITDKVGEEIGRITMELRYSGQTQGGWTF